MAVDYYMKSLELKVLIWSTTSNNVCNLRFVPSSTSLSNLPHQHKGSIGDPWAASLQRRRHEIQHQKHDLDPFMPPFRPLPTNTWWSHTCHSPSLNFIVCKPLGRKSWFRFSYFRFPSAASDVRQAGEMKTSVACKSAVPLWEVVVGRRPHASLWLRFNSLWPHDVILHFISRLSHVKPGIFNINFAFVQIKLVTPPKIIKITSAIHTPVTIRVINATTEVFAAEPVQQSRLHFGSLIAAWLNY